MANTAPTFTLGDGKLTTAISNASLYYSGNDVTVQPDGKIIVAGTTSSNGTDYDFAVVRYNANGSLDTTYDGDGKLTTAVGTSYDYARSVTLQPDGKIL